MKIFALTFIIFLAFCNCTNVQTQQISENKPKPTPTISDINNGGEEIGYPRFTTSDKQYVGCWRSVEASEVVEYELKFFRLTEKIIQTSKMSKPIAFSEAESNSHKDYFDLRTESKNDDIQPYLSINMVNNDEMTIHEFATKEDILDDGKGINYWDVKRENCEKVFSKFKK